MFEDSLVESRGRLASKSRRWITVGSVGLQCLVAAGIVVIPMVRPEALPFRTMAPAVVVPMLKKPPVVIVERISQNAARAASVSMPLVAAATHAAVLPTMRPVDPEMASGAPVPSNFVGMGNEPGGGGELFGPAVGTGARVTVAAPKRTEPVRISAGVSSGMLLSDIRPVYPRIAVVARVQGVVVIEATISKTGAIESARVVSGPAMLQGAAIDAVKAARYRPYKLNGEVTEVQTTITVNFRLGNG